jgi:hypothetical protein
MPVRFRAFGFVLKLSIDLKDTLADTKMYTRHSDFGMEFHTDFKVFWPGASRLRSKTINAALSGRRLVSPFCRRIRASLALDANLGGDEAAAVFMLAAEGLTLAGAAQGAGVTDLPAVGDGGFVCQVQAQGGFGQAGSSMDESAGRIWRGVLRPQLFQDLQIDPIKIRVMPDGAGEHVPHITGRSRTAGQQQIRHRDFNQAGHGEVTAVTEMGPPPQGMLNGV